MNGQPRRRASALRPVWVGGGLAALLLLLVAIAFVFWPQTQQLDGLVDAEPQYNVHILRDEWGVPHIFGRTDADVGFTSCPAGEVLRGQEKYDEAIEYHRKAHHLKEDSTRPLYALVDDYEARGDMDQARDVLGKIIAVNKTSVAAWRKLRSIQMKEGVWNKAQEAHERVVKLSGPKDPHHSSDHQTGIGIRYEIASARLAEGKAREAIGMLRRVIKDDGKFIPAHVKLGHAFARTSEGYARPVSMDRR